MIAPEELLRANGIVLPSYAFGRYYTTCPQCSAGRKPKHQKLKCLGPTITNGAGGLSAFWGCNHCGWTGPQKGPPRHELKSYIYRDRTGEVRFRKARNLPGHLPRFWLEHWDGGCWKKGTKGIDTSIIYRADEVADAIKQGKTICVVEGEKDADSLWRIGIPATCNAHGASEQGKVPKWTGKHGNQLRDADIVVFNDNDAAGYAHAGAIVDASIGIAKQVRRLDLKDHWPPDIGDGGDVSDWLAKSGTHTPDRLRELIEAAPVMVETAKSIDPGGFEDAVALEFAKLPGEDYRYVAKSSQWMHWSGTCWREEPPCAPSMPRECYAATVATLTPKS